MVVPYANTAFACELTLKSGHKVDTCNGLKGVWIKEVPLYYLI